MESELDIATDRLQRTIARHVKELRHERGYDNNVQFALMSKISRPYIDRIEKGKNISMRMLVRLSMALDVEPYELLKPYPNDKDEDES